MGRSSPKAEPLMVALLEMQGINHGELWDAGPPSSQPMLYLLEE